MPRMGWDEIKQRFDSAQLPDHHDDALRFVNHWRVRMGRPTLAELAQGTKRDPTKCSLAESLGTGWIGAKGGFVGCYWRSGDDYYGDVLLPHGVREFVVDFDSGRYPELEA